MTSNPTSPRNSESSREGDFDPNITGKKNFNAFPAYARNRQEDREIIRIFIY